MKPQGKKEPRQTIGLGWFAGEDLTPAERRAKLRAMGYDAPEPDANNSIYSASTTERTDTANQATPRDSEGRTDTTEGQERSTPKLAQQPGANEQGDVPIPDAAADLLDGENQPVILVALAREGEGRAACWERLRKEARAVGLPRGQGPGTAYEWATREVERLFPPPAPIPEPIEELPPVIIEEASAIESTPPEPPKDVSTIVDKSEEVSGLGDLPESWGTLPANASLQVEIAWVSANRLRVRSGSGVDLSRALSPAPSYSALSWLETSILFPSKFADISVKATAGQEDEREGIRREKLAIEEIRSLLAEMLEG